MRAITLRRFRDAIFVNHLNAFVYGVVKTDISMSKQAEWYKRGESTFFLESLGDIIGSEIII